jgi:hypothetical protein
VLPSSISWNRPTILRRRGGRTHIRPRRLPTPHSATRPANSASFLACPAPSLLSMYAGRRLILVRRCRCGTAQVRARWQSTWQSASDDPVAAGQIGPPRSVVARTRRPRPGAIMAVMPSSPRTRFRAPRARSVTGWGGYLTLPRHRPKRGKRQSSPVTLSWIPTAGALVRRTRYRRPRRLLIGTASPNANSRFGRLARRLGG